MTTAQHMPVSALQAQSECIIRSLGPDDKTAQRLAQMGILPGTQLRIIRVAPLGGTIEVTGDQGQSLALWVIGDTHRLIHEVDCPIIDKDISTTNLYCPAKHQT